MKKGVSKIKSRVSLVLQKFQDDWIPAKIVWPDYKGIRWSEGGRRRGRLRDQRRKEAQEKQVYYYMRRKRWVEARKTEKGLLVRLSDVGKTQKLLRTIRDRPLLKDGTVCLVMFDIPESTRKSRDAFRFFLKRAGFTLIQLSAWSCPRDVVEDVCRFIQDAHISRWVKVFIGTLVDKNSRS